MASLMWWFHDPKWWWRRCRQQEQTPLPTPPTVETTPPTVAAAMPPATDNLSPLSGAATSLPDIHVVLECIEKTQATSLLVDIDAPFFNLHTWRQTLCDCLVTGVDWAFLVEDAKAELRAAAADAAEEEVDAKEYRAKMVDLLLEQVMDRVCPVATGLPPAHLDWREDDRDAVISLLLHLEELIEHVVGLAITASELQQQQEIFNYNNKQ